MLITYVIQVEDRLALYNHLKVNNIFSVHYISYIGILLSRFHIKEVWLYHKIIITLLKSAYEPTLSNEEQDYVIDTILKFMK